MTSGQRQQNSIQKETAEVELNQIAGTRQRAIEWLLCSGIQNKQSGGVYAWFDSQKKQYSFLYPEITGYAISEFLFLHEIEKDAVFLNRAVKAADWILKECWDDRTKSMPFRIYQGEPRTLSYSYTFDSGMVLSGLVHLARLTGEKRYREAAVQIGDWISQTMHRPEGGFFCFWDSQQRIRLNSPDKWSTIPWGFLTKVARSLAELGELTGNQRYGETATRICEWAIQGQSSDGRYRILDDSPWVVSHPFLYTVEGLFLCGRLLGRSDFLEAARKGLKWLSEKKSRDGMILAELGERREPYHVRSDVQAQFLRMALLIPKTDISRETLLGVLKGLLSFQNNASSATSAGGFQFAMDLEGRTLKHSNAWCTLFAVQSLSLLEEWLGRGEVAEKKRNAVIRFFV